MLQQILLDESSSESIKKQSIKVARKAVIKKKRLGVETYLNYALNNEGKNWALILGLAVDVAVRKNWKDIIEGKKVYIYIIIIIIIFIFINNKYKFNILTIYKFIKY